MAGASARLTIESQALDRAMERLIALGEDPAPVLRQIGARMVEHTRRRFHDGKGPGGVVWPPSKRAQKTPGAKTLWLSGRLLGSMESVVSADGRAVEWGTNVVYAGVHQFGGVIETKPRTQTLAFDTRGRFASRDSTRRRRGGAVKVAFAEHFAFSWKMPARPFIGFDGEDRTAATGIVTDHLRAALEGRAQ